MPPWPASAVLRRILLLISIPHGGGGNFTPAGTAPGGKMNINRAEPVRPSNRKDSSGLGAKAGPHRSLKPGRASGARPGPLSIGAGDQPKLQLQVRGGARHAKGCRIPAAHQRLRTRPRPATAAARPAGRKSASMRGGSRQTSAAASSRAPHQLFRQDAAGREAPPGRGAAAGNWPAARRRAVLRAQAQGGLAVQQGRQLQRIACKTHEVPSVFGACIC